MKLTRDSWLFTVTFIGSVALFLGGHFELLTRAFPALGMIWQARIELVAALAGVLSAYLRMSPLALSQASPLAGTSTSARTTLTVLGRPRE